MINQQQIRKEFPIFEQNINEYPLIYLDNAATTQVPHCVVEEIRHQYENYNGNVHRGAHYLSEVSTERMEYTRTLTKEFIGAGSEKEIVFTSGTTGGINMLARMLEETYIRPGDEILVSEAEHHSNLLPWQQVCKRKNARLRVIPVDENGELDFQAYGRMLNRRTRLVAVTWVSNVLGAVNDVERIVRAAHKAGALVLLDGAQAMRHVNVDVQKIDCDFLVFSAHKMMGPTGVGILYGKEALLNKLPPVFFGGGMVKKARISTLEYEDCPYRFEAGTPNYVGIIAFGKTLEFLREIGMENIYEEEDRLIRAYEHCLNGKDGIRVLGRPAKRAGVLTFWPETVSAKDMAELFDRYGVAVRAGHHCAMPLLKRFGQTYVLRISPAFYNTEDEVERFSNILDAVMKELDGHESEIDSRIRID